MLFTDKASGKCAEVMRRESMKKRISVNEASLVQKGRARTATPRAYAVIRN